MTELEEFACELAAMIRRRAPMGTVTVVMPVGDPAITVELTIDVRGQAYMSAHRVSDSTVDTPRMAKIADHMIFEARKLFAEAGR